MRKPLWLLVILLVSACSGGPTAPSCVNVGGTWSGVFSNSCGQTSSLQVIVAQNACNFSAAIPGQGTITGTASGNSGSFTITFAAPCSGTATGTATLNANAITGTYSGRAIGCCDPVSGSFTLTR